MNFEAISSEITSLKLQISKRDDVIAEHEKLIALLREQILLLTQKRFGASSEKLDSPQLPLFDEAEVFADDAVDTVLAETDASVEVPAHTRKKKRVSLPESLPRVDVIHDLPESEKFCAHDGSPLKLIGEDVSEQQCQQRSWNGHQTILASLALFNSHHLTLAINIADLQGDQLTDPKP